MSKRFTTWLRFEAEDCGLIQPPLDPQKAVDFICDYLLGTDYYIVNPVSNLQANSQIVHDILWKYSSKYRKEYKNLMKRMNKK